MMRQINGITPPDEAAGKSLASEARGWQKALRNPRGSKPENAPLEAAGEGSGASDEEQK